MSRVAVVVGVGPGLGTALARRFHEEGYAVALLARRGVSIEALAAVVPPLAADSEEQVPPLGPSDQTHPSVPPPSAAAVSVVGASTSITNDSLVGRR